MEWLFQTENLRLRQDRESERLFKKKKKKRQWEARDFATAHAVSEATKTRGESLKSCYYPRCHAATTRERQDPPRRPTRYPHPPRDTHICFSLHTQVFNLFFKISESVLLMFVFLFMRNLCLCYYFFFLAFWLCDSVTILLMSLCLSLWIVTLCNYTI